MQIIQIEVGAYSLFFEFEVAIKKYFQKTKNTYFFFIG